ncbi:alpha-L-rhamnosidase C-terminal domain-containing protein [Thomasclavelia sp.]
MEQQCGKVGGAVSEDGGVSTYSYNHYAFGCIGEWMYREMGGLQIIEPGYKKFRVKPAIDCGLKHLSMIEETVYGEIKIEWELIEKQVIVHVSVPANTTAEIVLPNTDIQLVDSGYYTFITEI